MLAILNSSNAHNLPISQPILMILVSNLMAHRALSDKTYLLLGLLSPLTLQEVPLKYNYYCEFNAIALPLRFSWLKQYIIFKAGHQKFFLFVHHIRYFEVKILTLKTIETITIVRRLFVDIFDITTFIFSK